MNSAVKKRILIVCRKAPYGTSLAREAIDIALASTVFDQDVSLLFSGDGVWQLHPDQNSEDLALKNHQKMLSAFPLYGLEQLYCDQQALDERDLKLNELSLKTQAISSEQLGDFIDNFDVILSF